MSTHLEVMKQQILNMFEEINKVNFPMKVNEFKNYYSLDTDNYMWQLQAMKRSFRIFLSEDFGLSIEFGERTFGEERFLEKAKELHMVDHIFNTYDQMSPPQDVFEYKIENDNLSILKEIIIRSFQMK